MVDLNERLRSSADAFTEGLRVENPAGEPGLVNGDSGRRHERGRRGRGRRSGRWVTPSVLAASAAVVITGVFMVGGGNGSEVVVPAFEQRTTSTSIVGLELPPGERVRAAYDATFDSQSWIMTTSAEGANGELTGEDAGNATSITYQGPGLFSSTTRILDGSWVTNSYYDLPAGRQYWLHDTGKWKSAAMAPWDSPLARLRDDSLGGDPAPCVLPIDDLQLLVVRSPDGQCPATSPNESDWAALGSSKQLVTLTADGRLSELRTTLDESPVEVPGVGPVSMVSTFSDYDIAPAVTLPAASVVTEVQLLADGGNELSGITGFQRRDEVAECGPAGVPPGCSPN